MNFVDLKANLLKNIDCAYILEGVDDFLLTSAHNLIVKYSKIEMPELNVIEFKEGIIDFEEVIRALNTLPVFCDKKIVYVDLRMSKQSELKNTKALEDYLKSPNSSSVLIINIGNNTLKLNLTNNVIVVDCNRLSEKIVSLKIKQIVQKQGKTIDDQAIKLLCDYTLCDLSRISTELDKLVGFVGSNGSITSQDIACMVTPSLEYQVFELTDALAKKNIEKVYAILDDMKSKKDEYRTLPAIIFSHFRRLFMVSLNQDRNKAEIARLLGVKEYAVKMSMTQVGLFSKSQLKKIEELCNQVDFDLKQSNISIDNAINLIVLTILNI